MDIHHLKYFLAVCETLNFTKAAERCNVSQPALSRAVQQLEDEVGGLLFRRERSHTHLTDLGLLVKPHFEQVLSELVSVKQETRRFLTLDKANLRIGIMCTVGPGHFAGMLGHFSTRFPGISVQIAEGTPAELSEKLIKGDIDVAIMASAEGFHERFNHETLFRERFLLAFPKGHRFAAMEAIPIVDTDGENYLRRANCEYWDYLSVLSDACNARVHLSFASGQEDWIQNMVAGGLGICFIPEFSAVLPGIDTRPVIEPEVHRDVCLVTMAGRHHSPAVAGFLKTLRSYPFPKSRFPAETTAA